MRRAERAALAAFVGLALLAPPLGAQEPRPDREPLAPPVPVTLQLVPDPVAPGAAEPTVGDPLWATVRAYGPSGTYLLPGSVVDAYAAQPELAVLGTERRDGQLRLRIALFRPGDVVLPAVLARVATATGDTLAVPVRSDTFHVASVLAPGDTLLADIKPLWPSPGVPLWVWVALALALVAFAAVLWWWWRRRRAVARPRAAARVVDPYEEALRRLEVLAQDPARPEERIVAAAEIGEALRDYLAAAWGVPARERTTFEILPVLPPPLAGNRAGLGSILSEADLAKFARLAPEPGRVPVLAGRAIDWLNGAETARVPAATIPGDEEAAS